MRRVLDRAEAVHGSHSVAHSADKKEEHFQT